MDLSYLFSSKSKYKILRVLCKRTLPIHLRALAELADIQVRSAQLALESLLKEEVITKTKEANRVNFFLNPYNNYTVYLCEHFADEEKRKISARAEKYTYTAKTLEKVHELRMLTWQVEQANG